MSLYRRPKRYVDRSGLGLGRVITRGRGCRPPFPPGVHYEATVSSIFFRFGPGGNPGASLRSSNVGASQLDMTELRPTISPSSSSHPFGFGYAFMSPRASAPAAFRAAPSRRLWLNRPLAGWG